MEIRIDEIKHFQRMLEAGVITKKQFKKFLKIVFSGKEPPKKPMG